MTDSECDPQVSSARDAPPFWLTAASYWMPTHFYETRAWVTHAPFAFWLMDALLPRSIV